jgi:hypothetical protein
MTGAVIHDILLALIRSCPVASNIGAPPTENCWLVNNLLHSWSVHTHSSTKRVAMADAIRFVLSNVPAITFALAAIIALAHKNGEALASRLLAWLLLLTVGVSSLWAGLFHVFAPQMAAQSIGWEVSPFQFEIGVADISIGLVAIVSFWRGVAFKSAVVAYIVLFDIGVSIGHVRQAVQHSDYAANNFGLLLVLTVVQAVLLPLLLWSVSRSQRS